MNRLSFESVMNVYYDCRNIPTRYHLEGQDLELALKSPHFKNDYTLLGRGVETLSYRDRIWKGVQAIALTFFSLFFDNLKERAQKSWDAFKSGKRVVDFHASKSMVINLLIEKSDDLTLFKMAKAYTKGNCRSIRHAIRCCEGIKQPSSQIKSFIENLHKEEDRIFKVIQPFNIKAIRVLEIFLLSQTKNPTPF